MGLPFPARESESAASRAREPLGFLVVGPGTGRERGEVEAGGLGKPPKKQDLYPGNPLVKGRRGEEAAAGPGGRGGPDALEKKGMPLCWRPAARAPALSRPPPVLTLAHTPTSARRGRAPRNRAHPPTLTTSQPGHAHTHTHLLSADLPFPRETAMAPSSGGPPLPARPPAAAGPPSPTPADPAAAGPLAPARFLYQHLHDAIRGELAALVAGVAALEAGGGGGPPAADGSGPPAAAGPEASPGAALAAVRAQCRFLARVYKYHSAVEDEVRGEERGRAERDGKK